MPIPKTHLFHVTHVTILSQCETFCLTQHPKNWGQAPKNWGQAPKKLGTGTKKLGTGTKKTGDRHRSFQITKAIHMNRRTDGGVTFLD